MESRQICENNYVKPIKLVGIKECSLKIPFFRWHQFKNRNFITKRTQRIMKNAKGITVEEEKQLNSSRIVYDYTLCA